MNELTITLANISEADAKKMLAKLIAVGIEATAAYNGEEVDLSARPLVLPK